MDKRTSPRNTEASREPSNNDFLGVDLVVRRIHVVVVLDVESNLVGGLVVGDDVGVADMDGAVGEDGAEEGADDALRLVGAAHVAVADVEHDDRLHPGGRRRGRGEEENGALRRSHRQCFFLLSSSSSASAAAEGRRRAKLLFPIRVLFVGWFVSLRFGFYILLPGERHVILAD